VRRAFGHDDFQGGPDVPFAKMPGFGAAVASADDDMDMQGGLALWIIGDVANQRSDLDLLADRNLLVVLLLPVKVERASPSWDRSSFLEASEGASISFLSRAADAKTGSRWRQGDTDGPRTTGKSNWGNGSELGQHPIAGTVLIRTLGFAN
jgi:hypothetical protein